MLLNGMMGNNRGDKRMTQLEVGKIEQSGKYIGNEIKYAKKFLDQT